MEFYSIWMFVQFRKLTNYFLGFICFYDAIYGTAGIVPFVTMTSQRQIPLSVCFFLESPSPFSVVTSIDMILVLGLERLVSVLFPVCLVYCQSSDLIQGDALAFASNISLISNISTLVTYFLLWVTIKIRKVGNGNPGMGQQLNQSIFVLVIIYLGFWMTTLVGNIVLPSIAFDNAVTKMFYARLLVQLTRLATVLNAPVLYFCSTDYRFVFRKEMRRIIGGQSAVSTKTIAIVHIRIGQQQRNAHQQQGQEEQRRPQQQQPMINSMMMMTNNHQC